MSTLNVDTIQDKGAAFEHARLVQVVNTTNVAMTTGTTAIPHDDTIPQITEGDEILSRTITPTNANNILLFEVIVQWATASNVAMCCALFKDSDAGAICASGHYGSNREQNSMRLQHFTTGSLGTSQIEFTVRFGATSGTTTINGDNGARTYGGVCTTGITISEIRV